MTLMVHPLCVEECRMTTKAREQQGDDWIQCGNDCVLVAIYGKDVGVPVVTSLSELVSDDFPLATSGEPAWVPAAREYEAAGWFRKLWLRFKWRK